MTDLICRGSYVLGTACGKCKRCEEERAQMAANKLPDIDTPIKLPSWSDAAEGFCNQTKAPTPIDELVYYHEPGVTTDSDSITLTEFRTRLQAALNYAYELGRLDMTASCCRALTQDCHD